MSYPMNEFETDLEKAEQTADEWISSTADAAGTALHESGDKISAVMEQGRNIYKSVGSRVARDLNAANAVMHRNPYPVFLVGIGAGVLLGFLAAGRSSGRSG